MTIHRDFLTLVNHSLSRFILATGVLVLPLSMLLFAQWPLRELVQAYSREANDLAQAIFAVYVSLAITSATRLRTHLASDVFGRHYAPHVRRKIYRAASLLIMVPWSAFILWSAWKSTLQSVAAMEHFPETYNPGYFLVKGAVVLLAATVLLQSLLDGLDVSRSKQR